MAKVLRIPRPSVHLGLDCRPIILYAYLPTEEKAREAHTSRSSTDGFGRGSGRGRSSRSGAGAPGIRCGSHGAFGGEIWRFATISLAEQPSSPELRRASVGGSLNGSEMPVRRSGNSISHLS